MKSKVNKSVTIRTTLGSLTFDRPPTELLLRVLQGRPVPKRLLKDLPEFQMVEMNLDELIAVLELAPKQGGELLSAKLG
jgi:hypothetical protein